MTRAQSTAVSDDDAFPRALNEWCQPAHFMWSSPHPDLKADNCFVDAQNRVKVADFGTGRIQGKFQERQTEGRSSTLPSAAVSNAATTKSNQLKPR